MPVLKSSKNPIRPPREEKRGGKDTLDKQHDWGMIIVKVVDEKRSAHRAKPFLESFLEKSL